MVCTLTNKIVIIIINIKKGSVCSGGERRKIVLILQIIQKVEKKRKVLKGLSLTREDKNKGVVVG